MLRNGPLVTLIFLLSTAATIAGETRQIKTAQSVGIANDRVSILFDSKTGALSSLKNLSTNDEYLKEPGGDGNPFRVYVDTTATPKVLTVGIPYPIQPIDDAMGGKLVDPKSCELVKSSFEKTPGGGAIKLVSHSPTPDLTFEYTVTLPDDDVAAALRLIVRNSDSTAHTVMTATPYLTGLALGPKRETNLGVRLVNYGQSRAPAWALEGDMYGRLWNGQWNAVYEPVLDEGLGLIIKDPDLRNKALRRFPPSGMCVFYPEKVDLAPGQQTADPPVEIIVHSGNWKFVARRYRQWFEAAFPPHIAPKWMDDVDMQMGGAWFPSAPDVARAQNPPDIGCDNRPVPPGVMTSFNQLPRMFYYPTDMRSSSQYWQSVVTTGRYHAYDHTDGIYDIRIDLGGASAFHDGAARVSAMGRYYGLYVGTKTVRKDSPLLRGTNMQDWILMDTPDKKVPEKEASFYMCGGYKPWQDHLAATCAQLVRETGVKFIRLDEFAGTFEPCFNPAHHHPSPYGSIQWDLELVRKVRKAIDEVDPEVALFSEGPSDVTAPYLDGALNAWSTGPDIAPCQMAVPSLRGMAYTSGQIESALNGFICGNLYACNRAGWANGYHEKLWGAGIEAKPAGYPEVKGNEMWPGPKLRWHELSDTFVDAARHGDPTDVQPVGIGQNSDRWVGQLWRSDKYWLMVCGDSAAARPSAPVRVKLPELPDDVHQAYEFDVATLKMRNAELTREKDGIFVTITSGFAAVFLPRPDCPPLVVMDDPPVLQRDAKMPLQVNAFAPWRHDQKPVEVSVAVPGLLASPIQLSLPGTVTIVAATDSQPGYYFVHITGDCLRLKRWFIYDPAGLVDQLQPEISYGAY